MSQSITPDYFGIAVEDVKRDFQLNAFVEKIRDKINPTSRLMDFLIQQLLNSFVKTNLSLLGLHEKFKLGELDATKHKEHLKDLDEIIDLLTLVDELLEEINYFDNSQLKTEFKDILKISYKIEVDIKKAMLKGKKREPDPLFKVLAEKSKISLQNKIIIPR